MRYKLAEITTDMLYPLTLTHRLAFSLLCSK